MSALGGAEAAHSARCHGLAAASHGWVARAAAQPCGTAIAPQRLAACWDTQNPLRLPLRPLAPCSGLPAPPGVAAFLSAQARSPTQQCLVVSAWLELAVGAAAPFCILRWLEHRGRRAFEARQQREQGRGGGAEERGREPLQPPPCAVSFYLWCGVAWCVLCSLYSMGA